jgi:hypothetical protein
MTKQHIINEIKRTAAANGGIPLGKIRFSEETGIKESDWSGRYWTKWNDALIEAGLKPNQMQASYSDDLILEHYSALILDIGHIPTSAELRFRSNSDSNFPSHNTFSKYGGKQKLVYRTYRFCQERREFELVCKIILSAFPDIENIQINEESDDTELSQASKVGYVYLLRHGSRREYKIGKTFNPIRREGEIRLQLPEKLLPVHYIETDDPSGIEQYWHERFASKRKEGEWFNLSSQDVSAFKRWRKIY